ADVRRVDYNRDIRPILSDVCYKCHGPDEKQRKAGLRLDTTDGAFTKLETGSAAVTPGKSAESELFLRIASTDAQEQMPPPASGKKLTRGQIDVIKRWIDEGAEIRGHWAFIPARRPQPPDVATSPTLRNVVDRFILSRLAQEGLASSPEADRTTLIRRVTY